MPSFIAARSDNTPLFPEALLQKLYLGQHLFNQKKSRQSKSKVQILSIDGGGIRGIVPATILCHLEELIQERSGNPEARLSEYFDLLAGTSTGGILVSLYLTPDKEFPKRSKYSAKEVLELYMQDGPAIFQQNFWRKLRNLYGVFGKKYAAKNLKHFLQKALGKGTRMSELVRPCLIPAYNLHQQEAMFFRSQSDLGNDFKAWEIARATSAAPTYFEPATLQTSKGELLLADGGLFAKDPSLQAYLEAQKSYASTEAGALKPEEVLLVSIGTGSCQTQTAYHGIRKKGVAAWIKPLVEILTTASANVVQQQLEQLYTHTYHRYFRFDPDLDRADEAIDNACPKNIKALHEAGLAYVSKHKEMLNALVEQLMLAREI